MFLKLKKKKIENINLKNFFHLFTIHPKSVQEPLQIWFLEQVSFMNLLTELRKSPIGNIFFLFLQAWFSKLSLKIVIQRNFSLSLRRERSKIVSKKKIIFISVIKTKTLPTRVTFLYIHLYTHPYVKTTNLNLIKLIWTQGALRLVRSIPYVHSRQWDHLKCTLRKVTDG